MGFDLASLWFAILGFLLAGYAILDGFDLGVGVLHPFARNEAERRVSLASIGPLWDGNEVWLVTFGGGLFAAFPDAYATLLSAMYFPVIIVLFSLIGRAISIEFRSKRESSLWRRYWDYSFALSSAVVLFGFGLIAGNAMVGIPLSAEGEYVGALGASLGAYPIAVGVFTVAAAAMHGSIFLFLKTEGAFQARIRGWMWRSFFVFAAAWIGLTAFTVASVPHALALFDELPVAWVVPALSVLAILNVPRAIHQGRPGYAFVSSACTLAALVFCFGMALYPNLVVSSSAAPSLTVHSAASSEATLELLTIIAALGLPLVATYTGIVYWVFRGKVRASDV